MDPLTPTTATLTPAIAHIAETASTLSSSLQKLAPPKKSNGDKEKDKQRRTVQWVLNAPVRLRKMRDAAQEEEAKADWAEVSNLLGKWQGVSGAEEVRKECEAIMKKDSLMSEDK